MTSHAEFNDKTGAGEVADAFHEQIKGKNIVLTGVSPNSIGEACAIVIAAHEPGMLIIASRTQSKMDQILSSIKKDHPNANVRSVVVDLVSHTSIKHAAEEIHSLVPKLHILINNAGVMLSRRQKSPGGLEGQFAANHLGSFLLTNLLTDRLRAAASDYPAGTVRVINVSSWGHLLSPIRFHDYNIEGKQIPKEEECPMPLGSAFAQYHDGYNGFIAYGQSKTANVLFSVELTERLKGEGIVSYALHPGSIDTGLSRDLDADGWEAIKTTASFWKSFDQGGSTSLVAAFDPALNTPKGVFLDNCQYAADRLPSPHATDPEQARKLWDLSERLMGEGLP